MPPTSVDAAAVHHIAARLLSPEVVILPVRHHSPACALQVRRAIETLGPAAVLVEGPRSFTPLIPALTSTQAHAPLAVYTYLDPTGRAPEAPRLGAYYPFCDFSPELVALREATRRDIPVRFIDLELGEQHAVNRAGEEVILLDEHHFRLSDGLARLTTDLGCVDEEDLWENLFESDAHTTSLTDHLSRLTAYCLLARADATPDQLRADGTAAREAEMTWHVRQAISEFSGSGPVLVVVGGFHAVALPDLLADPPPRPSITAPAAQAALVRFSFDRVDRINGYAAGMTAPAWHQRVWDQLAAAAPPADPRASSARAALLDIADELDRLGRRPAQPSVTDAYTHTLGLASLRDHAGPLRSDLLDAVRATLIKGHVDVEGSVILDAARQALSGNRIGALPPGVAAPPLVADTLDRLRRARLAVDQPGASTVSLSVYRTPSHRVASRLLHGLTELDVPFATWIGGPDFVAGTDLHLITEQWRYRWSPGTEAALVEASRFGSTLPDAVAACFDAHLVDLTAAGRHHDSATSAGFLMRACRLGLVDRAQRVLIVVADDLGADPSFCGVIAAATSLALLRQAREPLGAENLDGLGELLQTAIRRALYLGRLIPAEPATDVVAALVALRELVAEPDADDAAAAGLFTEVIATLAEVHNDAHIRGGAVGLCYGADLLDGPAVAGVLRGTLAGTLAPDAAVAFVAGLLSTARETLWQEPELVDVLGDVVTSWPDEEFIARLPALRLAFAELTPRETDQVARVVARRLGVADLGPLDRGEFGAAEVAANVAASRLAADLLIADGLGEWVGHPGAPR
ncbi:DUF5682 family protein [Gordonia sp. VNK1]|uniref:DUF5682 family protein n=1 Tax=Gordonia oleivorans TaxID=3156618 RepID=UPI0032B4F4EE